MAMKERAAILSLMAILLSFLSVIVMMQGCSSASTVTTQAPSASAAVTTEPTTAPRETEAPTQPPTQAPTEPPTEPTTEPPPDVSLMGKLYPYDTEEIDISGETVRDLDGFIQELSAFTHLTRIEMCECGLSNEQMELLIERFPNIKFVWMLHMAQWTLRTDSLAFSTKQGEDFWHRLTDEEAKMLKYCTDLVLLDIGHNRVSDLSFLQYMPNLKVLILVDNFRGSSFSYRLKDLSALKYVPKLRYLEVFVGGVSDLSFLQYTPEIQDLNLSYNPVKDVTYLLNLPHLERLFIEHTRISEEDVELLRRTYPHAQIENIGSGSVDHGWRRHPRFYAIKDMIKYNYVHEYFLEPVPDKPAVYDPNGFPPYVPTPPDQRPQETTPPAPPNPNPPTEPETVPEETVPQETVLPETVPPETAPPETAPTETAPPETVPPETIPPETAPPETMPPETVPPETAPPETAPPETVPPETVPPETTPTETSPTATAPSNTEAMVP